MSTRKPTTLGPLFLMTMFLPLLGCDSELVEKFNGHKDAVCGCADAECAKSEHKKFLGSWEEMSKASIDWQSSAGKKDKKGIDKAVKGYRECLSKQVTAKDATTVCQESDTAKTSSESCTTCCNGEGRFFKSWVDPVAAGLAGALGAGDVKGCSCS